jgi:hypothetical protein
VPVTQLAHYVSALPLARTPLRLEVDGDVILDAIIEVQPVHTDEAGTTQAELRRELGGLALHGGMLAAFLFPAGLRRALASRSGVELVLDCLGRTSLRLRAPRDGWAIGLLAELNGQTLDLDRLTIAELLGAERLSELGLSSAWSDAAE